MTASAYMPDVQVEIAFNAGWSTPAASRTWTDVSEYVELADGITINFGRADELATADANTLTLTLDNTNGRFTPELASGANYPNVKLGRPIRVKSTRVGGSASTRFVGYIDSWTPLPGGTTKKVAVTASSQLARLGLDGQKFYDSLVGSYANLKSLFKLNETALPAVDTVPLLPSMNATSGTVTLRGGLGPEGAGTAVRFGSNGELTYSSSPGSGKPLPTTVVLEAYVSASSAFAASGDSLTVFLLLSGITLGVTGGAVQATHGAATPAGSIPDDGELHHIAAVHDGSTLTLYVDGAEVDSAATTAAGEGSVGSYRNATDIRILRSGTTGTVDVSYVAVSEDVEGIPGRALSAPLLVVADVATASERLTTFADYAGIESTDIDTTTELLKVYSLFGRTMLEAMRAAETTDGGVLYDAANGTLTYNDRESRYAATSAFTLSVTSQQIEASVAPKLDRSGMVNDASVTQSEADGVLARVLNQTSIDAYGRAAVGWEIQGAYDACFQAASWAVFIHGEPETRIPNLEVDLLALSTSLQDSLLAATIGTRFTASGLPADFPAASLDFFTEGYVETIGVETYRISLNVSKRDATKWDVWTLEDATYGAYDSNPLAW